jgi:hypothetical protein
MRSRVGSTATDLLRTRFRGGTSRSVLDVASGGSLGVKAESDIIGSQGTHRALTSKWPFTIVRSVNGHLLYGLIKPTIL